MSAVFTTLFALFSVNALAQDVVAEADFNVDEEGWRITTWDDYFGPLANTQNGQLRVVDWSDGATWYFMASPEFTLNTRGAYGSELSFTLQNTGAGSREPVDGVQIRGGNSREEITLYLNLEAPIGQTDYQVMLDASDRWERLDGRRATEVEVRFVINHLNALKIEAEYINGDDIATLDNVVVAY